MNTGAKVDYFIYKGNKYYKGSVFECKNFHEHFPADRPTIKVTFWEYNRNNNICLLSFNSEHGQWMYQLNIFAENIISVIVPKEVSTSENVQYNNSKYYHWVEDGENFYRRKPNDLIFGWGWYIFLMAIATIFKGNIVLWVLISFVFFRWRKKKIMEE